MKRVDGIRERRISVNEVENKSLVVKINRLFNILLLLFEQFKSFPSTLMTSMSVVLNVVGLLADP